MAVGRDAPFFPPSSLLSLAVGCLPEPPHVVALIGEEAVGVIATILGVLEAAAVHSASFVALPRAPKGALQHLVGGQVAGASGAHAAVCAALLRREREELRPRQQETRRGSARLERLMKLEAGRKVGGSNARLLPAPRCSAPLPLCFLQSRAGLVGRVLRPLNQSQSAALVSSRLLQANITRRCTRLQHYLTMLNKKINKKYRFKWAIQRSSKAGHTRRRLRSKLS